MRDASGRPPRSSAAALRKQFTQRINAAPIGESANSKRRSRQAGTKMKTTAIRSPTGSDDPPTRLSSPQQSFLAEVSRYGISHTTFELAPAMVPMPSFAVWRTVSCGISHTPASPTLRQRMPSAHWSSSARWSSAELATRLARFPCIGCPSASAPVPPSACPPRFRALNTVFRTSGERRNARAAWLAFKNYRGAGTYRRAQPSNKP